MKRLEIIMNQSVEEDFLELIEKQHLITRKALRYTKIPDVMGRGCASPKMGDSIWPQLNCVYIIYCDNDAIMDFADTVRKIRANYPDEGISVFLSDAEQLE